MSADDTYDDSMRFGVDYHLGEKQRIPGPLLPATEMSEEDVARFKAHLKGLQARFVTLSEGKQITDPDEAEALGLSPDFERLDPVVQAAVLEDRRRAQGGDRRHTFTINVRMRGHGCNWDSALVTQEIRAYSLNEALIAAVDLPLRAWFPEEGDE